MADDRDDTVQLPDIRSPGHRRALRERGRPHGEHILEDSTDDMGRPHPDRDTTLATLLADMRQEQRAARQAATPPKAGWTSLPAVLGAGTALISILGAAIAVIQGYTQLGERVQSFGERMLANDGRLSSLERAFQERGTKRDGEVATLTSNNALQDDRMKNFAVAIQQEREARIEAEADIRRTGAEVRAQVNKLMDSLSEIRTALKVPVDRAQRPRAGLASPDREAQVMPGR